MTADAGTDRRDPGPAPSAAPRPERVRRVRWGAVAGTIVLVYVLVYCAALSRLAAGTGSTAGARPWAASGARLVLCGVVLAALFHAFDGLRRMLPDVVPSLVDQDRRLRAAALFATWALALPCFAIIVWPWVLGDHPMTPPSRPTAAATASPGPTDRPAPEVRSWSWHIMAVTSWLLLVLLPIHVLSTWVLHDPGSLRRRPLRGSVAPRLLAPARRGRGGAGAGAWRDRAELGPGRPQPGASTRVAITAVLAVVLTVVGLMAMSTIFTFNLS